MYRVRMGGSPADSGKLFNHIDAAVVYAMDWAIETAVAKGDDADSIALCDMRPRGGSWVACPAGDDGAYYPRISEEP